MQAIQLNHQCCSAFDEGPGSPLIYEYFYNTCCFALFIFRKLKMLNFLQSFAV